MTRHDDFLSPVWWSKDLTGSDGAAALSLPAMWAPTLAGPALGTLADRVRRKPLLVGGNLLLAALLPALLWADSTADVWLVLAVLVVYGGAGSFTTRPSRHWSPPPSTRRCSATSTGCG